MQLWSLEKGFSTNFFLASVCKPFNLLYLYKQYSRISVFSRNSPLPTKIDKNTQRYKLRNTYVLFSKVFFLLLAFFLQWGKSYWLNIYSRWLLSNIRFVEWLNKFKGGIMIQGQAKGKRKRTKIKPDKHGRLSHMCRQRNFNSILAFDRTRAK